MNDFDAMTRAGLKACPADAFKDILSIADYQCKLKGGEGAFREFCEFIINSM
jgi:3-deoxy-D-manno-octulosonate 8-phosphate phosphatase KdsC-like HAD superfamily phosphatase